HLRHAAVDLVLFELEVGNAVAHQPADPILAIEQHDVVARAGELLRASHARRPGADHGDALAGLARRDLRLDPTLFPTLVDDRAFDRLDRDRVVMEVEDAGFLARRRADPPRELG